jgi:hypothetical protein
MKKITAIFFVVCISISLFSCADPYAAETRGAAYAYLAVLEMFWYKDSLTVVDLAETKIEDKEAVYSLMKDYCRGQDTPFMRYEDYETAAIPYSPDIEVVVLSFRDIRLTKSKLITEVSKTWPNYYEGFGTLVTVKRQGGEWNVTHTRESWIS